MKRFFSTLILIILASCAPGPRRDLTLSEKTADMHWIFSKFDHNYAPRKMKEKLHGFDYEELKKSYIERLPETKNNEEFYLLMHQFIAEFKDAHTSGSIQVSSLPGRTKFAYLGFRGVRVGSSLFVKKLLPTIDSSSLYPIKIGDKITKINGITLTEFIDKEFTKYRDLGNKQANYTSMFNSIFNRNSYKLPMPKEQIATVTLLRAGAGGETELTLEMPWIIKDLLKFRQEQAKAITSLKAKTYGSSYDLKLEEEDFGKIEKLAGLLSLKFIDYKSLLNVLYTEKDFNNVFLKLADKIQSHSLLKSFEVTKDYNIWDLVTLMDAYLSKEAPSFKNKIKEIEEHTTLIGSVQYHVHGSHIFPAYITHIKKDGKDEPVGYIRISSFSPGAAEKDVLSEYQNTLNFFKTFGVKAIVVDLLNNGGGSISLGLNLAQLSTNRKIDLPEMQYQINETWLDQFEKRTLQTKSEYSAKLAQIAFDTMSEDLTLDRLISTPLGLDTLYPFILTPNINLRKDGKPYELNYLLLVNEMCASMCDAFSSIMQDNKLGTVLGNQTMGAGGNVTTHAQAPNSGLILRQTESLIVRSREKKDYLENAGVMPDFEIETYKLNSKYSNVIDKAVELIQSSEYTIEGLAKMKEQAKIDEETDKDIEQQQEEDEETQADVETLEIEA